MTAGELYEFGPFRLDPAERRLLRDGIPVPLTPKCFDLLVVLVENAGHLLSRSELMERLWPDQFVEEANLSFNISELRKALGEGQDGAQWVETVRKQGFRFVAPVRRFAAGETASTPTVIARSHPRPAILAAVASAAVLVIVGVVLWMRRDVAAQREPVRTIAVLPFKPLVAAARDESLEMGMAETLITRLGAVRAVTVRPLSSVRRYTNLEIDPVAAGRALDVEAVIDGSIQRAGDRVRVTVRLTRVADGRALWNGTFDERFTDIFDVQDAISGQATRSLALRLSAQETQRLNRRETVSAEAYEDYLRGRYSLGLRTEEGIRSAIESFRRAVALDPASASAYSALADAYALLTQYAGVAPQESFPAAKAAAERALALDDRLAEAHTSLAFVREAFDWNWAGAEAEYRRALALDRDSATAHHRYGVFLTMMGRFDAGLRELEEARRLEPLSVIISADKGMASYMARRYDRAANELRATIQMDPGFGRAHVNLAECLLQKKMFAEALAEAQEVARLSGGKRSALLAYCYGVMGRREDALRILEGIRPTQPFYVAAAYAAVGDSAAAFATLEKGIDQRAYMLRLRVDPSLDPLRTDPRFASLMKRTGLDSTP